MPNGSLLCCFTGAQGVYLRALRAHLGAVHRGITPLKFAHHVPAARHELRPVLEIAERTRAHGGVSICGHGKYLLALLRRLLDEKRRVPLRSGASTATAPTDSPAVTRFLSRKKSCGAARFRARTRSRARRIPRPLPQASPLKAHAPCRARLCTSRPRQEHRLPQPRRYRRSSPRRRCRRSGRFPRRCRVPSSRRNPSPAACRQRQ